MTFHILFRFESPYGMPKSGNRCSMFERVSEDRFSAHAVSGDEIDSISDRSEKTHDDSEVEEEEMAGVGNASHWAHGRSIWGHRSWDNKAIYFLVRPLEPHGRNQRNQCNHPTRYTESFGSRLRTYKTVLGAPVYPKGKASEDIYEEEEDEEVVDPEPFFEIETPRFRWICIIRQELLAEFLRSTQEDVG